MAHGKAGPWHPSALGTRDWPERFWRRVMKPESDGCWTWTGSTAGYGYGRVFVDGRQQSAHRVAWELTNGPIPEGLIVCHKCDNPPCVRPLHLFLGTHKDNSQDMVRKQRGPGQKNSVRRGSQRPKRTREPAMQEHGAYAMFMTAGCGCVTCVTARKTYRREAQRRSRVRRAS